MKRALAICTGILLLIILTACETTGNKASDQSLARNVLAADSKVSNEKSEKERSEVTKTPNKSVIMASTEPPTEKATNTPQVTESPTQAPTEVPSLKNGSTGEAVTILQECLIEYGYLTGQPTGKYNNDTVKAVKDFQINNGLKESGKCDQSVWEILLSKRPVRQETVYKSKKGKVYHSKSNCSGMKNPTSMTLSDALRKKLRPCSHCH